MALIWYLGRGALGLSLLILACTPTTPLAWWSREPFWNPSPVLPCSLINADFCAGAVLISFGAVVGKIGPAQLLLMALWEAVLFSVNEFILLSLLGVSLARLGVSPVSVQL